MNHLKIGISGEITSAQKSQHNAHPECVYRHIGIIDARNSSADFGIQRLAEQNIRGKIDQGTTCARLTR